MLILDIYSSYWQVCVFTGPILSFHWEKFYTKDKCSVPEFIQIKELSNILPTAQISDLLVAADTRKASDRHQRRALRPPVESTHLIMLT